MRISLGIEAWVVSFLCCNLLIVAARQPIFFAADSSHQDNVDYHSQPLAIESDLYSNLYTYAHLIDISYCISSLGRIEEPFKCDLHCEERFPNVSLVYQWYFDDSVCGYIATTRSNIFNYNETGNSPGESKKTIIVSFRGTRSVFDTYTDFKTDMTIYRNQRINLPFCGNGCRVHKGFYTAYLNILTKIQGILLNELNEAGDDYELLILGHSMGGAVGLFLGLHFLDLGYEKMTLVTMGQPLVGNKDFVDWADMVTQSHLEAKHNSYDRKFLRIIHKEDIVATIPSNGNYVETYQQFDNQIYLNCSASDPVPAPEQVVDCKTGDNKNCIAGDFKKHDIFDMIDRNYIESHNTYLRKLGLCGVRVKS